MESQPECDPSLAAEQPAAAQYFIGRMSPVKLPLGYGVGLMLIAAAMVLLPVIYLGLIGLAGWGTYLYAVHGLDWFFPSFRGGRHVSLVLGMLYLAPILVG